MQPVVGKVTSDRREQTDARPTSTQRWPGLRDVPVSRNGLLAIVLAYVVLSAASIAVGFLVVDHLNAVRDLDQRVARWLGDRRTGMWNDTTWVGSGISDFFVKVPAAILLSIWFIWRWRRWNEAILLAGALVFEAAVFVTASFVVDRARPPISQLDSIPLTSSFPSGHTAAAVAFYGAIAVVVYWHTYRRSARTFVVLVAVVLVVVVGASRMYRGMHYLSDVVIGMLIGAASLCVMYVAVQRPPRHTAQDGSTRAAAP
jgi:membrane-associated phospholipid phosphatase